MRWVIGILLLPVCFALHAVPSQQTYFNRTVEDGKVTYSYRWYDHNNQLKRIRFSLDTSALKQLPQQQANYRPDIAMRYVKHALISHAKTVSPNKARVQMQDRSDGLRVTVRSDDPQMAEQLQTEFAEKEQAAMERYLDDHYYERFELVTGEQGIKADHLRYINEYQELLKPVAQAFYELLGGSGSPRQYIDLVLSWAQSIPYNELTGRGESNGAGFLPPAALIQANLGDCDSKSVLVASILRSFLPRSELQFALLPEHALLAISISPKPDDITYTHNGRELVFIEPTGPAALPAGEVAESTQRGIDRGLVKFQAVR